MQMIEEIQYAETMERYSHEIVKLGDEIQKGAKPQPYMTLGEDILSYWLFLRTSSLKCAAYVIIIMLK